MNKFIKFSIFVPLPSKGAVKYAMRVLDLAVKATADNSLVEQLPDALRCQEVLSAFPHFQIEERGNGISITSDRGENSVAILIAHVQEIYFPKIHFIFDWFAENSNDSAEPVVEGTCIVNGKDDIKMLRYPQN